LKPPTASLGLRIHVASLQREYATVGRANWGLGAGNRSIRAECRCADPAERADSAARRDWDLDVFWTARDQFLRQAFDVDALGRVVVRSGDDLDDLVAGELQAGDVCGRASHEVAVQDTEDGLVGDDQKVILLALELENDRLETDRKVVIGLKTLVGHRDRMDSTCHLLLRVGICGGMGLARA